MNMGLGFGLEKSDICLKSKFRWLFIIPGISADGVDSLPPSKSARPKISFKEIQVEHMHETIYLPGKIEFTPITLSLYDQKRNSHPIFKWIKAAFNPCNVSYQYPVDSKLFKTAYLELYDGSGSVIERWIYENVWPKDVDFGELDMSDSEVLTCDLTLRYSRSYIEDQC